MEVSISMKSKESSKVEIEETDSSWIYGPLASYCAVMDHLATSSFVFTSSTKQFLEQALTSGSSALPQDAEAFVKIFQSKVLKTILPIWAHPHFAECNSEFISAMFSIMRHIYSGVEIRNVSGSSGARTLGPLPDEASISMIVEMGFSRSRAEDALRQVGANSVELATDWLSSHPEEPQEEDDELARALAMSLGSSDSPSKEVEAANSSIAANEEELVQLPPVDDMLAACFRLLQSRDSLAFSVRDLLVIICSQNEGHYRPKVLTFIINHLKQYVVSREVAFKAGQFLVALAIRSTEGRRRIFNEISDVFTEFVDTSSGCRIPDTSMHSLVNLLNDILS